MPVRIGEVDSARRLSPESTGMERAAMRVMIAILQLPGDVRVGCESAAAGNASTLLTLRERYRDNCQPSGCRFGDPLAGGGKHRFVDPLQIALTEISRICLARRRPCGNRRALQPLQTRKPRRQQRLARQSCKPISLGRVVDCGQVAHHVCLVSRTDTSPWAAVPWSIMTN